MEQRRLLSPHTPQVTGSLLVTLMGSWVWCQAPRSPPSRDCVSLVLSKQMQPRDEALFQVTNLYYPRPGPACAKLFVIFPFIFTSPLLSRYSCFRDEENNMQQSSNFPWSR